MKNEKNEQKNNMSNDYEIAKFLLNMTQFSIVALIFGAVLRQDLPTWGLFVLGAGIAIVCFVGALIFFNKHNKHKKP